MPREADVLVIGGGPAGSTAAALLAAEGRRVVVAEQARFPRYHIGESLLAGVLPFLDELGVREQIGARGFQKKTGQTFIWGRKREPWQLDFRELDAYPYSFFVERSDFDELLLRNAQRLGATVLEEHPVRDFIAADDGRILGAHVGSEEIRARYTLDASGQAALLARRFGLRRFQRGLRNLAVWSYWKGSRRLPPPQDQHIFTVSIEDGWVWHIPLRDGLTSVGVVTSDWTRKARGAGAEAALEPWYQRTLQQTAPVWELLSSAECVEPVRAQRDWSYRCSAFRGPGWLLAGDAACFVDPILSTGVNLAMNAGYLAALSLNSALAEPEHEDAFLSYYERAYRSLFDEQLASVKHFYKVEAKRDSIYWKSKQLLRLDPDVDGALAFLFINSGLARHSTAAEPHAVAEQARALFASRLGGKAAAADGAYGHVPRRRLVPEGELVVVEGKDRRLYGLQQQGRRLELVPADPKGLRGRAPGTAFLLEIEARSSREPVGSILVEAERPGLGPHARVARGFALSPRTYAPAGASDRVLDDAVQALLQRIERGRETVISELERALRRERGEGWAIAEHRTSLTEQPVAAELARASDGSKVWLIARPRRPVEVLETPFVRTRFVDLEYRLSAPSPDAATKELLSSAAVVLRGAMRDCAALPDALEACQAALAAAGELPGGWRLVNVHRVGPA